MPSDSTKLLVDLREEGSRARWRGQKWKIFFPAKKAEDVRWDVVLTVYSYPYRQKTHTHSSADALVHCHRCLRCCRPSSPPCANPNFSKENTNGLLVHLLLRPKIKVTMRTMMLPMLWRDCLGWLPLEGSLQTCWRGMESKGVLTRMTMNMDGKIYKNV